VTILVDTSVWIDHFKRLGTIESDFLAVCIGEKRSIVLPGLVLTEILLGIRDPAEAGEVSDALRPFKLAPELTRADYEDAAAIYRACRARGITVRSTVDCLIAQLCLRYDYELLTHDRDFEAIGRFFPLRRVKPIPGVQEQARGYYAASFAPDADLNARGPLTRRRVSAPRPSSRASAAHSRATRR
jgi:predicted nucleic acid-binding protein